MIMAVMGGLGWSVNVECRVDKEFLRGSESGARGGREGEIYSVAGFAIP